MPKTPGQTTSLPPRTDGPCSRGQAPAAGGVVGTEAGGYRGPGGRAGLAGAAVLSGDHAVRPCAADFRARSSAMPHRQNAQELLGGAPAAGACPREHGPSVLGGRDVVCPGVLGIHASPEEVLAAADYRDRPSIRGAASAGPEFRDCTIHLHAVLKHTAGDARSWNLSVLSRQCGGAGARWTDRGGGAGRALLPPEARRPFPQARRLLLPGAGGRGAGGDRLRRLLR